MLLEWGDSFHSNCMHETCGKDVTKDENIGNHGYIEDISADILEKNIDKPKIDQNL